MNQARQQPKDAPRLDMKWAAAFCLFLTAAIALSVYSIFMVEGEQGKAPVPEERTKAAAVKTFHAIPVPAEKPAAGPKVETRPRPGAEEPAPPAEEVKPSKEITAFLKEWTKSWESTAGERGNIEAYMAFYSDDFAVKGYDKAGWKRDKAEKNRRKEWIRVELRDIQIGLPGPGDRVEVSFVQGYTSSDYSGADRKTLILKKTAAGWKILAEKAE